MFTDVSGDREKIIVGGSYWGSYDLQSILLPVNFRNTIKPFWQGVPFNASLTSPSGTTTLSTKIHFGLDYDEDLFISGTTSSDELYTFLGDDYIDASDGNDIILSGQGNDDIYGGNGRDKIESGSGNDYINGGEGSDAISAGSGDDDIYGQGGTDTIDGGDGDDYMVGGEGSDRLIGGNGNDFLIGGDGRDILIGGNGNDIYVLDDPFDTIDDQGIAQDSDTVFIRYVASIYSLKGGAENADISDNASISTLNGSPVNNILTGNNSGNSLNGLGGNDLLIGGSGNDLLNGGIGTDTADYSTYDEGIIASLATGQAASSTTGTDRLVAIENVIGSSGDDVLSGNIQNNALQGGSGSDMINGGLGNDNLNGGEGVDTADYSSATSPVTVDLSSGGATGAMGADTIASFENVSGGAGSDILIGNTDNNALTGNGGADLLAGGAGIDVLTGSLGADIFRFDTVLNPLNPSDNIDRITDFNISQGDRIQLENGSGLFDSLPSTATGTLATTAFGTGAVAASTTQRIIYNPTTGNLSYDPDGTGLQQPMIFATMATGLVMTSSQFVVT